MTWRDHAACKGYPTEWWYSNTHSQTAKAICGDCPVKADCHADAIETHEMYGIRAGLTMGHVHRVRDASRVCCRHCGDLFLRTENGRRIFCSRDCQVQHNIDRQSRQPGSKKGQQAKKCVWCGDPVRGGEYSAEGFCGWPCRRAHRRARTQELVG